MNDYTDIIRKWATDDRHSGLLDKPDGVGEVGLEAGEAGRKLAVRFTLQRQGERIDKIRYQVFGCGFTIAACAAAADLAEGEAFAAARTIDAGAINRTLEGLPAERDYCAEIAIRALRAALDSADRNGATVQSEHRQEEHGPHISENDEVFRLLMTSENRNAMPEEDRRMFAGVIALGAAEPLFLIHALGLEKRELVKLLSVYFPLVNVDNLLLLSSHATQLAPEVNSDVRSIIRSHLPTEAEGVTLQTSAWLADILTARAAHPGHLWVAMGFFERPELTAVIRRHLPTLAEANSQNMRWKRYLFKQACDLNGGVMCKSPSCGDCSDYDLCFAPE